jgi:hypothetical protein
LENHWDDETEGNSLDRIEDFLIAPLGNDTNWFEDSLVCVVDKGKNTLFWRDSWLKDGALGERFERLYDASNNKNITIMDRFRLWWGVGGGGRSWRRRLFVWEEERFLECIALLANVILQVNLVDKWRWKE